MRSGQRYLWKRYDTVIDRIEIDTEFEVIDTNNEKDKYPLWRVRYLKNPPWNNNNDGFLTTEYIASNLTLIYLEDFSKSRLQIIEEDL